MSFQIGRIKIEVYSFAEQLVCWYINNLHPLTPIICAFGLEKNFLHETMNLNKIKFDILPRSKTMGFLGNSFINAVFIS